MLPKSYEKVSEETKTVVQLLMAHARGFLQGSGKSDDEARTTLQDAEADAMHESIDWALVDFEKGRGPCSAEQFVQRFAEMVWVGSTLNHRGPFPFKFTMPVAGGPLSTEFLESIGKTEQEILQTVKKEERPEEDTELALHAIPVFVKTETSPPGIPDPPAAPNDPLAQQVKAEARSPDIPSTLGKRKNDEPENTASKLGRGNDGQKVSPGSQDTDRPHEQWGAPLTAKDRQEMNLGLMTGIWIRRISEQHMPCDGGMIFEVKIPKEKAWALLGRDIRRVFSLLSSEWRPIQLNTYESGDFLRVGLWIRESQTQGNKAEVMRHTMPELFRLLRRWSLQAQGSGWAKSLADFLAEYLGA